MTKRILIIGAGASGLMAAIAAAREGASVTVLEQNEKPGKKILASGNGRCNLTNKKMHESFYRGTDTAFIRKVLTGFDENDALHFFQSIGLVTFDRNGWVYPITEQSASVLSLLLLTAEQLKIKIKTNEHVVRVWHDAEFVVETETWQYHADAVIVAAGSPASSVKGASESAADIADSFGIERIPFLPALTSLKIQAKRVPKWSGIRIRGSITLFINGTKTAKEHGELQLTENGVSGIPVFQVSRFAAAALQTGAHVEAELNFMTDLTDTEFGEFLLQRWKLCPYKSVAQVLLGLLPDKLIPLFEKKGFWKQSDLTGMSDAQLAEWFHRLAADIRHYRISITGTGSVEQSQVCAGGILTAGLYETMESKKVKGLYFCGEAVDVDGCCGGYNLQWAWASGFTAGSSAASSHTNDS